MGGYESYFSNSPHVLLGKRYSVGLRGFDCWAKQIMTLSMFKQIRCAMHPDGGQYSTNGNKCHQLRHFICTFNRKARKIFHLGPNTSFDEGDAEHYFIYHLDCCQGKHKTNLDIDPTIRRLQTTQKAVANAILESDIVNDSNRCRFLYMDNRYATPQLFAIMAMNWNTCAVDNCKANRKEFDLGALKMDNASRRDYLYLVDDKVGVAAITVMEPVTTTITRCIGQEVIDIVCPNDIVLYHWYTGGVDRGISIVLQVL
eukprot:3359032-Ditylum_brightwellii.AAC.1